MSFYPIWMLLLAGGAVLGIVVLAAVAVLAAVSSRGR